jgi:hypothetical protein
MEEEVVIEKKEVWDKRQYIGYAISELCFVLLPFVVMLIVFSFIGRVVDIFEVPEWSILASVMFGQSIIKIIHYVGTMGGIYRYNVGAAIALIILLGLVPSLVVLSLVFIIKPLPQWLAIFQLILFTFSVVSFTFMNSQLVKGESSNDD